MTNANDPSTARATCTHCQSPNAAGGKFCRSCGKPLLAGVAPDPGLAPVASVGDAGSMTLALDAATAFAYVAAAIQAAGGTVTAQAPPQSLQFQLGYRNYWITGWMPMMFDGRFDLQSIAPQTTRVDVALTAGMGSLLRLAAGIALAVVVLLMGLLQVPLVVAVVAMAASVVFTLWAVKSKGPAELRKQLAAALLARSPAPESAPVAAAAAAAAVPVAAPAGGGPGAIEQLQRLAELRKLGAITEVEFEAKKADLLARV